MRCHRLAIVHAFAAGLICLAFWPASALAWHAEAGLASYKITLTGPGLGYLSDGPQSYTYIRRRGEANRVVKDVSKTSIDLPNALGVQDNDVLSDTRGGASYTIGSVSSSSNATSITFDLGNVNAKAVGTTYQHAEAWLSVGFYFDVVGTPVAGSTITVTHTLGPITFIEQDEAHAEAKLFVRSYVFAYAAGSSDPNLLDGKTDLQLSPGDPIALASYMIDLAGKVSDGGRITFDPDISAEATIIPEPTSLGLAALGFCGLLHRRKKAEQ
jgi:hypothetical protein